MPAYLHGKTPSSQTVSEDSTEREEKRFPWGLTTETSPAESRDSSQMDVKGDEKAFCSPLTTSPDPSRLYVWRHSERRAP